MCEHVTSIAQAMAAFISTYVDAEVVQRAIRNRPYNALGGDSTTNEAANATDLRESRIEEFVSQTLSITSSNHPETGLVRLDARDKFMKLVKKALLMCMSKHDQVILFN